MPATRKRKASQFTPKKLPTQERARTTFDAIVDACTWLLPRRGYGGTTTNHIAERAGVNIGSLYEYFPGKDAIIAQVAERMVERLLARFEEGVPRVLETPEGPFAMRLWMQIIYEATFREKDLVAVFQREIPYTNELEAFRSMGARLFRFSQSAQQLAGALVRDDITPATLHLLNNLVSSTILQAIHDPPDDISRDDLLDELSRRVEEWVLRPLVP